MPSPARLFALLAAIGLGACASDTPAAPDASHAVAHAGAPRAHAAPGSAALNRALAELRRETAPYHDFGRAVEDGFGARITPCWAHRTLGAMGYHYADPGRIDGTVSLLEPEVLMYEPQRGGHLRLVGMEYIVPIDAWQGESPPTLLGQEFHRHSFLPIYKLHIWLWRNNPRGIFADWNPNVSCDFASETEIFD